MRLLKRFLRSEWVLYLLPVSALYVTGFFLDVFTEIRLRHAVELVQKEGIVLDHDHYTPPEIPQEENASLKIEEMGRYDVGGETRTLSFEDENIKIIKEIFDEMGKMPSGIPKRITELEGALQPLKSVVDVIQRSIHLEKARFNADYSRPVSFGEKQPDYQMRVSLGYILHARAIVLMKDGNVEGAYETAKNILRLAKWCREEFPTLMNTLIGLRVIERYSAAVHQLMTIQPPAPESVTAIEQEMGFFNEGDMTKEALLREFMDAHHLYEGIDGLQDVKGFEDDLYWLSPFHGSFMNANHAVYLEIHSRIVLKLTDYPVHDVLRHVSDSEIVDLHVPVWAVLPKRMMPNYVSFLGRSHAIMTFFHQSRLSFALDEFKGKNGSYPDAIEELVPVIPPELLIDPFSGENYIYSKDKEGYVLYSIGYNQSDDGGEMSYDDNYKEGDYVWRLP